MWAWLSTRYPGTTPDDWIAVYSQGFTKLAFVLFFCALFLDLYTIWLYVRKRTQESRPSGVPLLGLLPYAFWSWHFHKWGMFAELSCVHFAAHFLLPAWRMRKPGEFLPDSASLKACLRAFWHPDLRGFLRGRWKAALVIGFAGIWSVWNMFYGKGMPFHYAYPVRGRVLNAVSGEPVPYIAVADCDSGDLLFDSSGYGGSTSEVISGEDGSYYLPPRISLFVLRTFGSRITGMYHPLYEDIWFSSPSGREIRMRPPIVAVNPKWESTNLLDVNWLASEELGEIHINLPVIKLEDKFGDCKDWTSLADAISLLPGRIDETRKNGTYGKINWVEVRASYMRMRKCFIYPIELSHVDARLKSIPGTDTETDKQENTKSSLSPEKIFRLTKVDGQWKFTW